MPTEQEHIQFDVKPIGSVEATLRHLLFQKHLRSFSKLSGLSKTVSVDEVEPDFIIEPDES